MEDPDGARDLDPRVEWQLRALALPVAFLLALAFNLSETGHFVQRTFLTMVPHELGHTLTAWWSGYPAVPTLWKTLIPETRSAFLVLALAAIEAAIAYLGWRANRLWIVGVALALGAAQLLCSTSSADAAAVHITFGGDAGAMVIGTALVLSFFHPRTRAGGLRWGLLAIGAAAYADTALTWWRCRADLDLIPFGEIEGVGLSDPSKLLEAGWAPRVIVDRYVTLAAACLALIAVVWLWQTVRMKRLSDRE